MDNETPIRVACCVRGAPRLQRQRYAHTTHSQRIGANAGTDQCEISKKFAT